MKMYKQLRKFSLIILTIPLFIFATGCSDDDPVEPPVTIDEYTELVKELEGPNGDYMKNFCPAIVKADMVYEDVVGTKKMYIIDVRSAADFATGHVEGAHNMAAGDVLGHVKSVTEAANADQIVTICYTGQTAAFLTAILRMAGYDKAFSMKYGMSAWHPDFDALTDKCSSNYESNFTTDNFAKGAVTTAPTLNTGKTTGADILTARVEAINTAGFGSVAVLNSQVVENPNDYYVINYWSDHYTSIGHLTGAMQYVPKVDLHSSTFLNTLPADKTIAVYCYTGQTSANVAAILSVMGYDAKTVKFGTNAMIWDIMKAAGATHWDVAVDGHDYDYVQ